MMTSPRVEALVTRLVRGQQKTNELFGSLSKNDWQIVLYDDPQWNIKSLLAHFVSSEQRLLEVAQDIAAGGPGAPGLNLNEYNALEQARLANLSIELLLQTLQTARQNTINWANTLQEAQLDLEGEHPVLGRISLENMILAIYGHQLMHMRDLQSKIRI